MFPKFKYQLGDHVLVYYNKYKRGEAVPSIIIATKAYQSIHFKPDYYTVDYCCLPLELQGLEHDDEEWVPECHKVCLPTITGKI